jgi:ceramide glucosyltransferase
MPNASAAITSLGIGVLVRNLAAFLCITSIGYYTVALLCAARFRRRASGASPSYRPPITILKPLRGLDPQAYENFASFCRQTYPEFQLVFGAETPDDPAIAMARRVAEDFPHVDIRILAGCALPATNRKAGCLAGMLPAAKHPFILVSDSDIHVDPDFLSTLIEPMTEPGVGVVTCLYRSRGRGGWAGRIDALGLSTDFQPSVLVARTLEGITFGMGSGILIRRAILDAFGGFEVFADCLADDYHLGNLPSRAGHRVELARCVVEHRLGTRSFRDLIDHQLRWNRGTRSARPGGYTGLVLTQGVAAALLLFATCAGAAGAALASVTLAARLAVAWTVAVGCLDDRPAGRDLWLVPIRDLFGVAMWIGGFFGNSVVWRGIRYRLEPRGMLARGSAAVLQPAAVRRSSAGR